MDLHGEVRRQLHVGLIRERRDPLRDEGIAYAQRLMGAGVRVELYNAPGAFHGFLSAAPDAAVSRRVMSLITEALRRSA
ncbi:MAG TPA: alpha/beta hydrolase fold domain-containing protein [Propionibacteriaceae bacterium]|nr:alpha/beta hydrolase fold domain-containing protein [Propionibacteriaceae bacterium]